MDPYEQIKFEQTISEIYRRNNPPIQRTAPRNAADAQAGFSRGKDLAEIWLENFQDQFFHG